MKITLKRYKLSYLNRHLELLKQNNRKPSKEKESIWIKKAIKNYQKDSPKFYTLTINLNNKMIGNIVAEKIKRNKSIEIGYWLGKKYWNKGYMTKVIKMFIKKIEKMFHPKIIYASCNVNNIGSTRVLNKNGFNVTRKRSKKIYFEKRLR